MKKIQMKKAVFFFCLILFSVFGFKVLAVESENKIDILLDKLVEAQILLTKIQEEENIASSGVYPLDLGDYLKDIFEEKGIVLSKEDFFQPAEDVYLEFARMLNLIPSSWESGSRISKNEATRIKKNLALFSGKILLDGLYGKIDAHEHYRAGADMAAYLKASGALGVSKTVFLPTGWGPNNAGYKIYQKFLLRYISKIYPDKIIPFCTIDEADLNAAQVLEECLKEGGRGLKLMGGRPDFYDEPLDSENMYKVYKIAEKYKVLVLIHGSIINLPQLKSQLDKVFSDFPDITFIHAHYCSTIFDGINLEQCSELLDKHPNVYTDLSMGGGIARYHRYFREDLQKVKDFIIKYQDRILFGSDMILDKSPLKNFDFDYQRMRCDIDLHENKEYKCAFGEKNILHQGFNLDKTILRKLYFENPRKALGIE